jgi:site-specific recombinase XerD
VNARLDDPDVTITAGTGHVEVAPIKVGMPRRVPLPAETRSAITAWHAQRGQASPDQRDAALFVGPDGQRLSASSVARIIREVGRDAGLEISPATLRHSYATNLACSGNSPAMIARLLGHARVDLARRYAMQPAPTS